jgi:hypothetical protein
MTEAAPIVFIKTEAEDASSKLAHAGISSGHFTNGVYSFPASLVVPTVLAGFQYAVDKAGANDSSALIIAVNSDKSMALIDAKSGKPTVESEEVRARKVAEPLALQHPDRQVVVLYYDEETPNRLYDALKENGFSAKSLFKWGYGTNPQAGVIEGAENFDVVRGFPLPNDIKPVCAELTRMTDQKGSIEVVDLRGTYISSDNKCLFRVLDSVLLDYAAKSVTRPTLGEPSPPK